MQYYVYALINPRTNKPFYIGKGKDKRVKQHFIDAKLFEEELSLIEVSDEEQKELDKFENVEKLAVILELFKEGTHLIRKDGVFLPNCWRKGNMTDDIDEIK